MLRWIIITLVIYLVYLLVRGKIGALRATPKVKPQQIQDEMVEDPVCKVYIPKRQALVWGTGQGEEKYFCSPECRKKYQEDTLKEKEKVSSGYEGEGRGRP
jgi:YHS domain-containing protein